MKDYVVLDIENPNFRQNSICAIGTMLIRDNKVQEKKYSLINPEDTFDQMNIQITKITPHMVENSPTLPEYWDEIESWLTNNVVVGHNITYDLRVMSKSLQRYNMLVPEFDYCCTLTQSRRNLTLPSYKLENIAKKLHIIYNPHNAIEDARAAYELFEHMNRHKEIGQDQCKHYKYKPKATEKYDPKLSTNINNLYGIIRVLLFEEYVSQEQLDLLYAWQKENIQYKQYPLFKKVTAKLDTILNKGVMDGHVKRDLSNLVDSVKKSSVYNENTLKVQILQGIIKTITADQKVTMEELIRLKSWLMRNMDLRGTYPYDRIYQITDTTLRKGFITLDQQKELSLKFQDMLTPIKKTNETINVNGKTFCLSGDFKHGSKEKIVYMLEKKGMIQRNCVSGKLDYLFVGDLGSPAWKYGNMGGKIVKAQQLQDKGSKIKIISETNLFKELNK